jgi:anti-sigma factor RsiW
MTLQHPHAELSAYIDGALAPAAQTAVDGHLVVCALCRAHLAQLRATVALVRALPDPVPSRRLVPRLARAPAWLAPLRTLMSLASGAAVFLFIASALATNITFLAGAPAVGTTAREVSGDSAANAQASKVLQPTSTSAPAPAAAPVASPGAAFSMFSPTASPTVDARTVVKSGETPDDAKRRLDQSTASPSSAPDLAFNPQTAERSALSEPRPSPLLNPWLWLTLAIVCAAIAIALHRRLRVTA